MKRNTVIDSMQHAHPAYRKIRRLRPGGDHMVTLIQLNVVNGVEYLPTPWIDIHVATRQECAPLHEIKDYHAVMEFRDGTWIGW